MIRTDDTLLDAADDALDAGDAETAVRLATEALRVGTDDARARSVRAEALQQLGRLDEADADHRAALQLAPADGATWADAARFWFDTLRFQEAAQAADRALDLDPDEPAAWYVRALLRERSGDADGAHRCYLRAHTLSPDHFQVPVPLEEATVERIVEEALRELPDPIRGWLRSVAILLEDVPDEDVCRQFDPMMPPSELLGCFSGPSMRDRTIELDAMPGPDRAWRLLPPSIVLYRRNLERMAHDEEDLVAELRVTVFHEIGHFLGLDEDDLVDRGLD